MRVADCHLMDEIFTHIDPDDGTVRHFNATAVMREATSLMQAGSAHILTTLIEEDFVRLVKAERGIEQWKVDRLSMQQLVTPLVGVLMPDDSVLLIDGHHRMVALHTLGASTYQIFIVGKGAWGSFLVEDMPAEIHEFAEAAVRNQNAG